MAQALHENSQHPYCLPAKCLTVKPRVRVLTFLLFYPCISALPPCHMRQVRQWHFPHLQMRRQRLREVRAFSNPALLGPKPKALNSPSSAFEILSLWSKALKRNKNKPYRKEACCVSWEKLPPGHEWRACFFLCLTPIGSSYPLARVIKWLSIVGAIWYFLS